MNVLCLILYNELTAFVGELQVVPVVEASMMFYS